MYTFQCAVLKITLYYTEFRYNDMSFKHFLKLFEYLFFFDNLGKKRNVC